VISLVFSGCDLPFYTKYQIGRYLGKTEKDFTETSNSFIQAKKEIAADISETENIKESVDQALKEVKNSKENLEKIKSPEGTQDLKNKLFKYYQDLDDLLREMQIVFNFLSMANQAANDLSDSANKLPDNFDKSTAKLIKEFIDSKNEYDNYLENFKNQQVPDYFYQAKISLTAVLEAYSDYLTSVIKGLKTKNNRYFDVDQFVRQMDDGMSRFTTQIETIERRGEFDQRSEEISTQEEDIKSQISDLKEKYKIK
jgi:small-conductance mechanosensitive channel